MSAASASQGQAMYVATQLDQSWLLSVQRKLHRQSQHDPDYTFRKLWGFLTDPRHLRAAVQRVASNRGRRTAGVDRLTVARVLAQGVDSFVAQIRTELRSGAYRPSPVRRVLIPKPGQPGKCRPLGIPTVKDRVVQAAVKNILEPIFEADFFPSSYGFRPGRGVHAALEELRMLLWVRSMSADGSEPRFQYPWAIEGDIKGCFDNIAHHGLMSRVRRRVGDTKVNRLVVAFLKAGILAEDQFLRSEAGTPQGGILSPLLANIALSVLDERYERHVWPRRAPTLLCDAQKIQMRALANRRYDRNAGRRRNRPILVPVRYADDFIILVGVPHGPGAFDRAREVAHAEKAAVAALLRETLHLELSETKTLVTPVTKPLRFLGHHVRVQRHPHYGWCSKAVIPKERSQRLRTMVKRIFGADTRHSTLKARLDRLNPLLRGWGNFYRHAWGAKRVFTALDNHVWWTIYRWVRKKHRRVGARRLLARYSRSRPGHRARIWRDGETSPFALARLRVERFRHAWNRPPDFAQHDGEPGA